MGPDRTSLDVVGATIMPVPDVLIKLERTGIAVRDRSSSLPTERPARQPHAGRWFVGRRELEHSAVRRGIKNWKGELERTGIAVRDRSSSLPTERPARQPHAGRWFVGRRELEHSACAPGDPPSPGIAARSELLRCQRLRVCRPSAHREVASVVMPVLFALCLSFSLSVLFAFRSRCGAPTACRVVLRGAVSRHRGS